MSSLFVLFNLIQQRVTNILYVVIMPRIKRFFKRKNNEKAFHIATDLFHSIFFPCPNCRRDVIKDANAFFFCPFCNAHIEARIIDQQNRIRFERFDVLFAKLHVSQDSAQVHDNLHKTHKGQFSDMFRHGTTHSSHFISTPKTNVQIRIILE